MKQKSLTSKDRTCVPADLLLQYKNLYRNNLLEDIIPFWESHSLDKEYGGYFSCLDRRGNIYDTDKFVWLVSRQAWTFSMLYNRIQAKQNWYTIAKLGIDFLKLFGRNKDGNFYFSLSREGMPITQPYSIYSDCFATLAFHEYSIASGDSESRNIAKHSMNLFLDRRKNPKGSFEKTTGHRKHNSFGLPMMTAYLCSETEDLLEPKKRHRIYEKCLHQIFKVHYNEHTGLIHENVGAEGQFLDTFEGRLINPGHALEAMWFAMEIADKLNIPGIIDKAVELSLRILEFSWDRENGGIFYFLDSMQKPLLQLEWDQKLWWVHQEALIALSKGYLHSGRNDVWDWYERVHEYTWSHFPDSRHGEWYGYLNRQGSPHLTLKGGKWKSCYHTARFMVECWNNFEQMTKG